MLVEITNYNSADIALNKWHLVHNIDGIIQQGVYVRFALAWDLDGSSLSCIAAGKTVIVDLEFNGCNYP